MNPQDFQRSMQSLPFPVHSLSVRQHGRLLSEEYFEPFKKGTLHRMFSVSKSLTALAIGALIAEEKLSLDARITDFFPEYVPENAHPYLTRMTIDDMLSMRTCHKNTTYKINLKENWVRSFFVTAPDHRSGQIFKYDTSSAHTLAALVKKLSGMGVVDYLRSVFLDETLLSKDAYMLTDPFGDEIGGSGLIAYPTDLDKIGQFLLSVLNERVSEEYPLLTRDEPPYNEAFLKRYAAFIKEALSFKTSTLHEGKTLDECQGYGYQIWQIRDGISLYGMGGQYVLLYPQIDLVITTTADCQAFAGGTQILLDSLRNIALGLGLNPASDDKAMAGDKAATSGTKAYSFGTYRILDNPKGLISFSISETEFRLQTKDSLYAIPYGHEKPASVVCDVNNQTLYTTGRTLPDGSLYLNVKILDEYVGSIHILIRSDENSATLYLRKIEESLFDEFNGFFEAVRV